MKARIQFLLVIAICAAVLFAAGHVHGANDDIARISVEELKKLVDGGAGVVIVDAQIKKLYDKAHIAGARSLPWAAELKPADVEQLPKDKLIVVYCDCGPGEADSSSVAKQLDGLGFHSVKVLADPSIRGWTKAGYPIQK